MIKFGFHATAALYTGGSVAQFIRLIYYFPLKELPYVDDQIIVILGSIGATTKDRKFGSSAESVGDLGLR